MCLIIICLLSYCLLAEFLPFFLHAQYISIQCTFDSRPSDRSFTSFFSICNALYKFDIDLCTYSVFVVFTMTPATAWFFTCLCLFLIFITTYVPCTYLFVKTVLLRNIVARTYFHQHDSFIKLNAMQSISSSRIDRHFCWMVNVCVWTCIFFFYIVFVSFAVTGLVLI